MRVYLIRHGKTEKELVFNSDGFPDMKLTDIGQKQAHLTGKHLSKINFDAVYSSDLVRANETAEIISTYQEQKSVVTIDKRIREIHMGIFHNSSEDQIKINHPEFYNEFIKKEKDFSYPDGESGEDVKNRVLDFLNSIEVTKSKNICVVCHGGVIRSIISHFLELPQHKRFKFYPCNCGISILEYDNESNKFRVLTLNEFSHLDEMVTY